MSINPLTPKRISSLLEKKSSTLIPKKEDLTVPPSTPDSNFSFSAALKDNPTPWPRFEKDVQIPYIREVGVKSSLEILSNYFRCPEYKINPVQFWFLDIIADCIWKLQDEYQFPQSYQKIIVHWILFVMEMIRDPKRNLTRKKFFKIFSEALMIAEEHIQTGCEILPEPTQLFILVRDEEEEKISLSSISSSGQEQSSFKPTPFESDQGSYVAIGADEDAEVYKLPDAKCLHRYIPTPPSSRDEEAPSLSEESEEECSYESIEFYKADSRTPERFLSLSSSSSDESSESTKSSSNIVQAENPDEGVEEEETEKSRTGFHSRFIWEDCSAHSNKSRRSCPLDIDSTLEIYDDTQNHTATSQIDIKEEWLKFLENPEMNVKDAEKNMFVNSCALFAIKKFVYDYFYETFQFTLAKLALINSHGVISQTVNKEWVVPKVLKEELKKPKIPKEKKHKKKKEKKHKKKKDKKKKHKKGKKGKKGSKKLKKHKKKKLTKEEKAELLRLKRERERLEEEARKAEENRRLLFPLKDATSDEFFKNVFEHWVKPKHKADKKKGKKKKK